MREREREREREEKQREFCTARSSREKKTHVIYTLTVAPSLLYASRRDTPVNWLTARRRIQCDASGLEYEVCVISASQQKEEEEEEEEEEKSGIFIAYAEGIIQGFWPDLYPKALPVEWILTSERERVCVG